MHTANYKKKYFLNGNIKLKKENNIFTNNISASQKIINQDQISYFFTGRLFDKKFYIKLLSLNSEVNEDISDIDIIHKGYEVYGEKFFKKLRGKYSIVIVNNIKREAIIIRDRSGLIPMYFYNNKSILYFSINLNELLKNDFKKILDKEKLVEYFSLYNFSKTSTFYQGVNRVKANSILKFDLNKLIKIISYKPLINNDSYQDFNKSLIDTFAKALDYDKNSKSGLILSGGIDSASIGCTINSLHKEKKLSTYSVDFNSDNYKVYRRSSEKEYQNIVKNKIKSVHTCFDGSKFNPINESKDFLRQYGQPFYYPNSYILNWISNQAKDDNIKVLYSGIGGDTTISWGYESLRERFFKFKFYDFFKELKLLSKNRKISRKNILKRIFIDDFLLIYFYKIKAMLLMHKSTSIFRPAILNKEFLETHSNKYKTVSVPPFNARKYHEYIVNAPDHQNINELIFSFFNDNGIEHIAPFYNEFMINKCLNTSPYLKLKNGLERYYFRNSMKDIVPEKIRLRQEKANVGIAFLINFRDEFLNESESFVSDLHEFIKSIINIEILDKYMQVLKLDDNEISKKSKEISMIYMIKILDMWLKEEDSIEY